jgi:hypothetical protein
MILSYIVFPAFATVARRAVARVARRAVARRAHRAPPRVIAPLASATRIVVVVAIARRRLAPPRPYRASARDRAARARRETRGVDRSPTSTLDRASTTTTTSRSDPSRDGRRRRARTS